MTEDRIGRVPAGMRWAGVWHGGVSYGHAYAADSAECFPTIERAGIETWLRARTGVGTFRHLDGTDTRVDTPSVEGGHLDILPIAEGEYIADVVARMEQGEYARRITIGPRGGIRMDRA